MRKTGLRLSENATLGGRKKGDMMQEEPQELQDLQEWRPAWLQAVQEMSVEERQEWEEAEPNPWRARREAIVATPKGSERSRLIREYVTTRRRHAEKMIAANRYRSNVSHRFLVWIGQRHEQEVARVAARLGK